MEMQARDRALLFWFVCIPLRIYLSTWGDNPLLRALGLVIGVRWTLGLETGKIGGFGGVTWWSEERVVHGMLWLGYAVTGNDRWLQADVALGVVNWLVSDGRGKPGVR
jgi:hypothetical protein